MPFLLHNPCFGPQSFLAAFPPISGEPPRMTQSRIHIAWHANGFVVDCEKNVQPRYPTIPNLLQMKRRFGLLTHLVLFPLGATWQTAIFWGSIQRYNRQETAPHRPHQSPGSPHYSGSIALLHAPAGAVGIGVLVIKMITIVKTEAAQSQSSIQIIFPDGYDFLPCRQIVSPTIPGLSDNQRFSIAAMFSLLSGMQNRRCLSRTVYGNYVNMMNEVKRSLPIWTDGLLGRLIGTRKAWLLIRRLSAIGGGKSEMVVFRINRLLPLLPPLFPLHLRHRRCTAIPWACGRRQSRAAGCPSPPRPGSTSRSRRARPHV